MLERTLTANSLGAEAERQARGRLVKAAHGGASAPGQHGADESANDSPEGLLDTLLPQRPRNEHDQALFDIITGGVLIIHVRLATSLKPADYDMNLYCLYLILQLLQQPQRQP